MADEGSSGPGPIDVLDTCLAGMRKTTSSLSHFSDRDSIRTPPGYLFESVTVTPAHTLLEGLSVGTLAGDGNFCAFLTCFISKFCPNISYE
jgi:hypothetical protein